MLEFLLNSSRPRGPR